MKSEASHLRVCGPRQHLHLSEEPVLPERVTFLVREATSESVDNNKLREARMIPSVRGYASESTFRVF